MAGWLLNLWEPPPPEFVDVASEWVALYTTHSHGEETLATRGGLVPGQMRWSDIHPPGLRVLPKGSPPI